MEIIVITLIVAAAILLVGMSFARMAKGGKGGGCGGCCSCSPKKPGDGEEDESACTRKDEEQS